MSVTRVRNAPVVDYAWQSDAACMGANGELFLGPDEERPRDRVRREGLALLVCNACPVRSPCLEHALAVPERHGVWGGTTPEQRLTMRRGGLQVAGDDYLVDEDGVEAVAVVAFVAPTGVSMPFAAGLGVERPAAPRAERAALTELLEC